MNETSQKRIKQHCCGGLRYSPSRRKKRPLRESARIHPKTHTTPTSQHSRAHQHRHTFASAPPLLRAPAPIAAPAPFLPKTHALRHRTLRVAAHTRGLTHTHNILYEASQKRIRKNCRGGFSPSTARVAKTHQCGGRRPRTANKKTGRGAVRSWSWPGTPGREGKPPPSPRSRPSRCEHGAEEGQGASRRVPHLDRCD